MKKILVIVGLLAAVVGSALAQNQVIATSWTNISVTVKAADSNSPSLLLTNQNMSQIYGIRLRNTGAQNVKYAFGGLQANTNVTLLHGATLAPSGSIAYSTGSEGAVPSFPLIGKTDSNGATSTLEIELLKRP